MNIKQRTDRRSCSELAEMLTRKVRIRLTAWEKNNIKEKYAELTGAPFPKSWESCGSCWVTAIKSISKGLKNGEIKEEVKKEEKPETESMNFPNQDLTGEEIKELKYLPLLQYAKSKGYSGRNPKMKELLEFLKVD